MTEQLVKLSELQIRLRNKSSSFLKLEENRRGSFILNQQVILLRENQKTEPVQEKNKFLHVLVHEHAALPEQVGAETSGVHKSLPSREEAGVTAPSWS